MTCSFSIALSRCVSENIFCNSTKALSIRSAAAYSPVAVALMRSANVFPAPSLCVTPSVVPSPSPDRESPLPISVRKDQKFPSPVLHKLHAPCLRVQFLQCFFLYPDFFRFACIRPPRYQSVPPLAVNRRKLSPATSCPYSLPALTRPSCAASSPLHPFRCFQRFLCRRCEQGYSVFDFRLV